MKYRISLLLLLFCLSVNAYGMETEIQVVVHGESMDHGSAQSLAIYAGSDVFYGGLSLSHIRSSEVIQYDNRKTIHPIFLFMGLKAPWEISPYIEAGIDLPEAIIDDLLDNEEKGEAQADYYFSGGIVFSASDLFSVSLYAKEYSFIFREDIYAPTNKIRPRSYGVGVSIRF